MPFQQSPSYGAHGSGSGLNLSPSLGSDGPRHYAAGYISTSTSSPHSHLDHSQLASREQKANNLDQDDWIQSPLHPNRMRSAGGGTGTGSVSKNLYRLSGGGGSGGLFSPRESQQLRTSRNSGIFGSSTKLNNPVKSKRVNDAMEDDAPPKESLLDDDLFQSKLIRNDPPGHRSLVSSLSVNQSEQSSNTSSQRNNSASPPRGYRVHVFGFTPSQQSFVINHFVSIGELACPAELPTEGGNWATLTFKHSSAAQRAVRKNGEILGGIIMVGCKWVDEAHNACQDSEETLPLANRSALEARKLGGASGGGGLARSSSMIITRPLKTFSSSEAFASTSSNSANEKGLMGMISSAGKPNPAIFQDREDQQKTSNQGTLVNRALDLVFGW
ncbi:hypothetical protein BY996DRAFT_6699913 [Phakopsora pachyrhizi]|uniref:RRM Nup35-type domain-containing protein n=1 Tax=Phakopsora pachyrhizi TaxID=170000 RepID=A0AAV0AHZ4_PHAPC|nr:hypothetical protein BY996DRAFT_6699913 [Phakopsora pachyrhizi]CAH7668005.1 hypothetical protein PPACK8108_LOCUS2462 [Phakopsora pachyrhizi]CAH7668018.1 hypothetical protein PPACK8108_LOCUS2475 [Phakopsora pachyrhizi]